MPVEENTNKRATLQAGLQGLAHRTPASAKTGPENIRICRGGCTIVDLANLPMSDRVGSQG
jgi:hypothetical protein